jgi:CHASE2 domain-containing sensor protein
MIQYAKEANCDLIKNKIVLLGGAYKASDEHDTPFGWMLGVDILAHTIETELNGGGLKPAPKSAIILLEIFDGFVLLFLFQRFRFGKAILLGVVAIPILSMTCSLIAFRSVAFWAYFAPILVAILVQQLWEQAKEYRKTLTKDLADGEAGKSKTPGSEKQQSHSHGGKRNQRRLRVR